MNKFVFIGAFLLLNSGFISAMADVCSQYQGQQCTCTGNDSTTGHNNCAAPDASGNMYTVPCDGAPGTVSCVTKSATTTHGPCQCQCNDYSYNKCSSDFWKGSKI